MPEWSKQRRVQLYSIAQGRDAVTRSPMQMLAQIAYNRSIVATVILLGICIFCNVCQQKVRIRIKIVHGCAAHICTYLHVWFLARSFVVDKFTELIAGSERQEVPDR